MRLISQLFKRAVVVGRLEVKGPNGLYEVYGGTVAGPEVTIRFSETASDFQLALKRDLWMAESYMDGDLIIEKGSVYDFLSLLLNKGRQVPSGAKLPLWRKAMQRYLKIMRLLPSFQSSPDDLQDYMKGQPFFKQFLGSGMHFSCAYWDEDVETLEEAQVAKLRHIATKLALKPDQTVLDIGCGWGGMALYLASIADVKVTGVTLSPEQSAVAQKRAEMLGLQDRVEFRLQDYRGVSERFDRIVSVAMLEHVGRKNLDAYFSKVRDCLNPDGVALVHSITSKAPPAPSGRFIKKYIDADGCAPSLSETFNAVEKTGLWTLDCEIWRLHYAKTLQEWRERFEDCRDNISQEHGERCARMWEYYLALCECAFEFGQSGVFQIQLGSERDVVPITRDYISQTTALYRERELDKIEAINASLQAAVDANSKA